MGAKILILEDDVPSACEMKAALAEVGCTVEVVRDGNAGLARAVSSHFDLIVASVELPGMNGFRLVNRLRKDPQGSRAPIFLVSGQPSTVFDEHRKLPTRAESYFQKPIIMAELIARARGIVPSLVEESKEAPPAPPSDVASPSDEWSDFVDEVFGDVIRADSPPAPLAERPSTAETSTLDRLRARIAEHEETNVRLLRELGEARAAVERATAARAEASARMDREVQHWKSRSLSVAPSAPGSVAHDELMLRQHIVHKDAKLARVAQQLDQAAHANRELKEKASRLEGDLPVLKEALADLGRQNAEMEKLLSAARADKEQASRRALDLSRRLERVRPDIEQAEQALARERADREAEAVENARVVAEMTAQRDAERNQAERRRTDELSACDTAHALEVDGLRTQHESVVLALRQEVSELRAQLEIERNDAATREQTHREELLRESRSQRAEHVDALAVAERGFEHKQAVLRHEFEGAQAKLREHAAQRIQEAQARLADATRSAAKRAAEIEQRVEAELAEARRRAEALEHALEAERALRGEQLSAHGAAMAEAHAERARQQAAADERAAVLRAQLTETLETTSRNHLEDLRLAEEHERAVGLLRQELGDAHARAEAKLAAAMAAQATETREHAAALEGQRAEHERALAAVETRYEERIATLAAEREASIQEALGATHEQLRRATEEFGARERELREAKALLEERHRSERGATEKAIGELSEALRLERQARADDAAAHSLRIAEVARASDAELGQHLDRHRAEQERRDAELRRQLGAQYEQDLTRERQSHEAKVLSLQQDLHEARDAAQRELAALEERWRDQRDAALRAKAEELASSHERALFEATREKSEELAAVRRQGEAARRDAEESAAERVRQIAAERDARVGELERALAVLALDRDRIAEAMRVQEAAARLLESERNAGVSELESYREKLAMTSRRHEVELGEAERRLQELEQLHAATVDTRDVSAADELRRAQGNHERATAALQDALKDSRAEADRAREDAAAFEIRTRQEFETRNAAVAAANADALASAERRFEAQVADALRRGEEQLSALGQDYERRLSVVASDLERKTRELHDAIRDKEERAAQDADRDRARAAAIAEANAHLERALGERELEATRLATERAKEVAEITKAHEGALDREREKARRDAKKEAESRFEREIGQAMIELRTELEVERAQTLGQIERAHSAALRRVMENGERERLALSSRVAELNEALASRSAEGGTGGAPELEERDGAASASMRRLEALARSRAEDVVRLERELDEARTEWPALEAEVAALRTELTSMRLQLDDQTILAGASKDELELAQRRLANAEKALAAALARGA